VLVGIRHQLLAPDIVSVFLREYREERKRLRAEGAARRHQLEAALAKVEAETKNLVDSICRGLSAAAIPALNERLTALEAERVKIRQELDQLS
jgi:site-specific DNA recombinase